MNIARFMSEELIKLDMETVVPEYVEGSSREKWRQKSKELILSELVDILAKSERTGNQNKLLNDFVNRERKATTAIGYGIAIPHIRSMQAKSFLLSFARSSRGYDFGALDEQPTRLFFAMAAPPYDDIQYLRVFKGLAEMLRYESFREELMEATTAYEIIRSIESMG
ncbi:PTS sugar transporter subunit IIA [Gemmatimonas aurantiaca]|nr:PTS sugar transporter subunit IIA [Gemmatimonas aurantiaca]